MQTRVPDLLEYDKLSAKTSSDTSKVQVQQEKNNLARNKMIADKEFNVKKLKLDQQRLASN